MSFFLLLLKIIGILLLSLLGLIILIILFALFCPFSYSAKGNCQKGQKNVRTRISWLVGFLALCVDITGETVKSYIRVCGIRLSFPGKRSKYEDFEHNREGVSTIGDDNPIGEKPLAAQQLKQDKDLDMGKTDADAKVLSRSVFSKIRNGWAKGKDVLHSLRQMVTHGKETCSKISSLWENESCKAGIKFIIRQLFSFMGKFKPRKFRLNLSFSTGSPDTTGELLGVLSLLPVTYQNRWEIMPDFVSEEAYADAVFDISGRLFGIQILRTALAIILDKNCRKLYNKIMG